MNPFRNRASAPRRVLELQMAHYPALLNKIVSKIECGAQRPYLHSRPVVVDVVLTKACNFACTFCKDYETEGAQRISLENFERLAAQLLPTASQLSICS